VVSLEQLGMTALFIDGSYRTPATDVRFTVVEPATGAELAQVCEADPTAVHEAVVAARRAFEEVWPRLPAVVRAGYLADLADALNDRVDDIAQIEARDTGIPLHVTRQGHLPRAIAQLRYFSGEAERLFGEAYPYDQAYVNVVTRDPVGVVGVLTPWSSPLSVATLNVAAALASGNTCVLKPSELAPLSVMALAEAAREVELPPGVLNIVHGGPAVGRLIVEHPDVAVISFTGGTATGRSILASAAHAIKRVGCELGGCGTTIIFSDANPEMALDGALLSAYGSNGESCIAGSRLLVERPLFGAFLDALVQRVSQIQVGDPLAADTEVGPLITHKHVKRLRAWIERACSRGLELRCGGGPPGDLERGSFLEPTVLSALDRGTLNPAEELFGPIATVTPFDTPEEAVSITNDTLYGLGACIWTSDIERGLGVAKELRVGSIGLNSVIVRDIRVPFGGYKQSGIGRQGGSYSLDLFTELKAVSLPIHPFRLPRLGVID